MPHDPAAAPTTAPTPMQAAVVPMRRPEAVAREWVVVAVSAIRAGAYPQPARGALPNGVAAPPFRERG